MDTFEKKSKILKQKSKILKEKSKNNSPEFLKKFPNFNN